MTSLTGQDIGEASGAVTALLEHTLSGSGVSSRQFVILRVIAVRGPWSLAELEDYLVSQRQLALDAAGAAAELAALRSRGLVNDAALTDAGAEVFERLTERVGATSASLYSGIAPDDLATARSVLRRVISRSEELRALGDVLP